jgi:hypothetical protein
VWRLAVNVSDVREIIDESLELLKKRLNDADSQGLVYKLESVRSVLIRKEKKIWLRTKKGREMVAEISEAADRLKRALASSGEWDNVDGTLGEVEILTRAIEEESRKRNMVVT